MLARRGASKRFDDRRHIAHLDSAVEEPESFAVEQLVLDNEVEELLACQMAFAGRCGDQIL